jgi:hypothetical protein
VEDGADVGLVDAHAEGDGGDNNFELAGLKGALDMLADGGFEAGVVGGGGEVAAEFGGEFFGSFARGSVDAGRFEASRRSVVVKAWRRGFDISTTSMARLERRNPWMKSAGLWSWS